MLLLWILSSSDFFLFIVYMHNRVSAYGLDMYLYMHICTHDKLKMIWTRVTKFGTYDDVEALWTGIVWGSKVWSHVACNAWVPVQCLYWHHTLNTAWMSAADTMCCLLTRKHCSVQHTCFMTQHYISIQLTLILTLTLLCSRAVNVDCG